MYKRFGQLSFIIGFFFILVSVVLFINTMFKQIFDNVSIYTSIAFMVFGLTMIYLSSREKTDN
ncbi:MAG: hypothetical protein ACKVOW_18140 [Chitinophagaceae bacterium]